jgi:competence protein ComEC
VWLAPSWTAHLAGFGVPLRVAEAVAIPAAAQLVTTPVIAGMSGRISVVGVLANMLAEPAVPPATVLGVLAAAAAPAWAPAAQGFALLAGPPLQWLIWVAHTTAGFPIASLPWPGGLAGGLLLAAVLAAGVVCLRWRRLRVLMLAAVLLALVVVVPVKLVRPGWPPAGWAMVDCDVGQGDAEILSTAKAGRVVLVDTGPEGGGVTDCLDRLGVRAVSMVLLSHLHADHMGGLAAVLDDVPVGAVAVGQSRVPGWAWQKVRSETTKAHVPLVALTRGQRLSWPGLSLNVIAPLPGDGRVHDDSPDGTEINNTSVVLRARTAVGTILLTGDIELGTQADLLASHADLTADVLKIPHHGSRYSLTRFLAAVHSRIAVASVGAGNSYGHPSPLTLSRLRRDGALVLRTDKAGSVAIVGRHGTPEAVRRGNPKQAP